MRHPFVDPFEDPFVDEPESSLSQLMDSLARQLPGSVMDSAADSARTAVGPASLRGLSVWRRRPCRACSPHKLQADLQSPCRNGVLNDGSAGDSNDDDSDGDAHDNASLNLLSSDAHGVDDDYLKDAALACSQSIWRPAFGSGAWFELAAVRCNGRTDAAAAVART